MNCVDLIICDTPDNSRVPGVKEGGLEIVPTWNMVKKTTFSAIFHVADALLADSGFLLLFVPAEEQPELLSNASAQNWECIRTFYVVNHRPFVPQWVRPLSLLVCLKLRRIPIPMNLPDFCSVSYMPGT